MAADTPQNAPSPCPGAAEEDGVPFDGLQARDGFPYGQHSMTHDYPADRINPYDITVNRGGMQYGKRR